jgi:integrase/recombinase XerD
MLYLTADDLAALAAAILPASLVPARDVFLFCCYTGLRYSDVHQLHGGNLSDLPASAGGGRVLRLTQTKTRTSVAVHLSPPAAAILDKYACAERTGQGARLLPVPANQVMNRYFKRVARLAGLSRLVEVVEARGGQVLKTATPVWDLVTMHTARHTFAVQSSMRGMPLAVLQKVMGHAKITTTMIYAKVIEDFQH